MAPDIADPFSLHWYVSPGPVFAFNKTLPPEQNVVAPPAVIEDAGNAHVPLSSFAINMSAGEPPPVALTNVIEPNVIVGLKKIAGN